jgi:hypothetical protein
MRNRRGTASSVAVAAGRAIRRQAARPAPRLTPRRTYDTAGDVALPLSGFNLDARGAFSNNPPPLEARLTLGRLEARAAAPAIPSSGGLA